MRFSVRNFSIAIAFAICSVPSYAEDWSGTYWEDLGKCYPSLERFMKSRFGEDNYPGDENVRVMKINKDKKGGQYYQAGDYTSMRGVDVLIGYKKKNSDEVCLLGILLAADTAYDHTFSDEGNITEIRTGQYTGPVQGDMELYYIEINYRPNKQNLLFPSKCAYSGKNRRIPFNCYRVFKGITPSPPSFDCTNPKKLNHTEEIICNDSDLAALDFSFTSHYRAIQGTDIGEFRDNLISDQHEWLKRRNSCNGHKECISDAYKSRIAEICTKYKTAPEVGFSCGN